MTELNVDTGTSDTVSVPQLGAGDPPYFLARIGKRLILWAYDIYSLDPNDLHTPPVKIADGSWFFVPSANPDRVWVIWKNEKASTLYHFFFSRVREMTADGTVTGQGPAHGDAWMDGAVSSGVVFETNEGLLVWDPLRNHVVARLPAQPPLACGVEKLGRAPWAESLCRSGALSLQTRCRMYGPRHHLAPTGRASARSRSMEALEHRRTCPPRDARPTAARPRVWRWMPAVPPS